MSLNIEAMQILESVLAGVIIASAFLIGALIAIFGRYSVKNRAIFTAFGGGVFLATTAYLIQETLTIGNSWSLIVGFILGAASYYSAKQLIKKNIQSRKKPENNLNELNPNNYPSGRPIIVGTILDSVPEALFVGIIIALNQLGVVAAVIVVFLGNLAATLEGAKRMKMRKIENRDILKGWIADFLIVAAAAPIGFYLAHVMAIDVLATVLGFAAGTLIVFTSSELITPAYRESMDQVEDISISLGFLIGVILLFIL